MGYSVKLYPRAYRDLSRIYREAYGRFPESETALGKLECLEEGILKLGKSPAGFADFPEGQPETLFHGRYYVAKAGDFRVVYKISIREAQVEIVTVQS